LIQVRYLRVRTGRGWQEPYDLDYPVVAIVGPVDTGKSSLLDCVAFAMGREIDEFRGVVDEYLHEVELGIRTGTGTYVLRRSRRRRAYVEVLDASGTSLGRFPVRSGPGRSGPTISTWLLQEVGLDNAFSAVRLPGDRRLDFATSLLSYCYLTQEDIDRHIIQPRRTDESRLIVLRLMLHLTTTEYEKVAGDIRVADNEISRRRRQAAAIRAFLEDSALTRSGAVQDEIADLQDQEREAKALLARLQGNARAATWSTERERQLVSDARAEQSEAETQLDLTRRRHDRACARIQDLQEQLDTLDAILEGTDRIRARPSQLNLYCPECGGGLQGSSPPPGHCRLCKGPLPPHRMEAERARILDEFADAQEEAAQLGAGVQAADDRAGRSWDRLRSLREEFDAQSRESVTPYVDAITDARSGLARIQQELATLDRIQDAHSRLRQQFDEISELQKEQEERRRNLVVRGTEVRRSEDVLAELSSIFRKIIRVIELPNATGKARLDEESLLPLVDEQRFSQRGGGARSAVSIAYSLALLTYAREETQTDLPTLLMVDSPKKNFGSNKDDEALARRVYQRFIDHMTELSGAGHVHRPFQLMIVDNDIHRDIERRVHVVRFNRQQGFIRDLDDLRAGQAEQLTIDDLIDGE
jgi:hypothetical protein